MSDWENLVEDEESGEGEIWNEHKKERKAKKKANKEFSINLLLKKGFRVITLNEACAHYRVGEFNFWPTTGKYYNPKTGEKGRGVNNLISAICSTADINK